MIAANSLDLAFSYEDRYKEAGGGNCGGQETEADNAETVVQCVRF